MHFFTIKIIFRLIISFFVRFNNSIHTMYSMEPIYDGERFLLQLFFQRPTLEEQEALA